jgi:hypothetical protein
VPVVGVPVVGDVPLGVLPSEGEDGVSVPVEVESPVCANAIPGTFAIAAPTPSATANAPTRPTYFAYRILVGLDDGARLTKPGAACFPRPDSFAALLCCIITGLLR